MIRKSIIKIASVLLIIGLNWAGLSAVINTFAYFSDTKISTNNTFQAGVLDMTLRSGQNNFVPPEIASNMAPGDSVTRDIYVGKTTNSLPLKHSVSYKLVSGSEDFCSRLQLKIWYNHYHGPVGGGYANRDMRLKYDGPLTSLVNLTDVDFIIPHPDDQFDTDPIDGTEQWFFYQITFPTGGTEIEGQTCDFKFVFESWQVNLPDSSFGFSDTEEIYSTLIDSVFVEGEATEEAVDDKATVDDEITDDEITDDEITDDEATEGAAEDGEGTAGDEATDEADESNDATDDMDDVTDVTDDVADDTTDVGDTDNTADDNGDTDTAGDTGDTTGGDTTGNVENPTDVPSDGPSTQDGATDGGSDGSSSDGAATSVDSGSSDSAVDSGNNLGE